MIGGSSLEHGSTTVPGPAGAHGRLLVAGDVHGNLEWVRTVAGLAAEHGCDGIVQLGDFGFWPDLDLLEQERRVSLDEIWLTAVAEVLAGTGVWMRVLDGNHDAHPIAAQAYPSTRGGISPIRSGILDWARRGARWVWCGVMFGALGGAASVDKDARVPGVDWWPTELTTDEDVARLGGERLDVLFTHDAPRGAVERAVPGGLSRHAVSEENRRRVERARQQTRPDLLLHGHHHVRYSTRLQDPTTRVEGLASEAEGDGRAWGVLALPSLLFVDGQGTVGGGRPDARRLL